MRNVKGYLVTIHAQALSFDKDDVVPDICLDLIKKAFDTVLKQCPKTLYFINSEFINLPDTI